MLTNFTGTGVGFGIELNHIAKFWRFMGIWILNALFLIAGLGVGCGFGVGWGFGGMPLHTFGLGIGGGCGVGLGLGWGFGSAFGSQYRSSRVTFHGIEFDNKGSKDTSTALDSEKHTQEARSSQ